MDVWGPGSGAFSGSYCPSYQKGESSRASQGGRLMKRESLWDGQMKKDILGRLTKYWGKTSATRPDQCVCVKIIQMWDIERKFELEWLWQEWQDVHRFEIYIGDGTGWAGWMIEYQGWKEWYQAWHISVLQDTFYRDRKPMGLDKEEIFECMSLLSMGHSEIYG